MKKTNRPLFDPYPLPKDKAPLFVNDPSLTDRTLPEGINSEISYTAAEDNVRVYVPMDLSKEAFLRRIDKIINRYGEANEANEFDFSFEIEQVIAEIEIYDRIWYLRHMPEEGDHSSEGKSVISEVIAKLEEIPDGCTETFPFELIAELRSEWG